MSAHNFENNVQQKMEELQLSPSDAVWTNVEGVIRKDKRRRRIIFLFSTAILLGLTGWLVSNQYSASGTLSNNTKHSITDSKSTPENSDPSSTTNDSKQEVGLTSGEQSHKLNPKETIPEAAKPTAGQQELSKRISDKLPEENKIGSNLAERTIVNKLNVQPAKLTKTNPQAKAKKVREQNLEESYTVSTNNTVDKAIVKKTVRSKDAKKIATPLEDLNELVVDVPEDISSDKTMKSALPMVMTIGNGKAETKILGLPDLTQNALNKYVVNKKDIERNKPIIKSGWHYGINGSIGLSKLVQGGIFNAFEKSLVADAASINTSVGLPGPVNLQSRAPLLSPAAVNAGPAFSIGGFAERKILKRVNVNFGLSYAQFSTRSKIGYQVDSSLFLNNFATVGTYNRFYQNTPSRTYYSKYHFIELPVNLQFRLTKPNKLPVYINGGMSVGYLFSTNALQYDGSYGLYYSENSLYRKWQFGLSTGLSVRLFSSSKHPLEFGPQFRFNPSNNFSSNKASSEHLFSAGLQFKWYLK